MAATSALRDSDLSRPRHLFRVVMPMVRRSVRGAAVAVLFTSAVWSTPAGAEPPPNDELNWFGPYAINWICLKAAAAMRQPPDCNYRTDIPGGPGFYFYRHGHQD